MRLTRRPKFEQPTIIPKEVYSLLLFFGMARFDINIAKVAWFLRPRAGGPRRNAWISPSTCAFQITGH
jgi:hypothetical protein